MFPLVVMSTLLVAVVLVPIPTVFGATASHFLVANRTECELKNDDRFESDMAKLLVIGEHGRNYPETFKQLKPFCEESRRITNRLDHHKNQCFRGTWKQFVSIFLYSNRNAAKQFCQKNNRQTKEIIRLAGCVNGHRKRIGKCLNLLIDNMVGIKHAQDKKKVPFLCCEYVKFTECFRAIFEEDDKCRPKLDATLDYMRSIMGNLINTGCGEYNEDTDKCQSLGPVPAKRSGDKSTVHKTFVYPIFDVLDSIKVEN